MGYGRLPLDSTPSRSEWYYPSIPGSIGKRLSLITLGTGAGYYPRSPLIASPLESAQRVVEAGASFLRKLIKAGNYEA